MTVSGSNESASATEKKKDCCVPGYTCVGSDTGWTASVFSHVHNRCEADLEKDTSDVQLVSKTSVVEPVRTDVKLQVGQLQSLLREARRAEDFSLAGVVNLEWECAGRKIARGFLWSVLLRKSEAGLVGYGKLWIDMMEVTSA